MFPAGATVPGAAARFSGVTATTVNTFSSGTLDPPTGLALETTCSGTTPTVTASWTAPGTGITPQGYRLQHSYAGSVEATRSTTGTSTTDTGMTNGRTYGYSLTSSYGSWSSSPVTGSQLVNCSSLVTNGDFENGTGTPWKDYDNNSTPPVTATARQGAFALVIGNSKQVYTVIPVAASTAYTFSVWAHNPAGASSVKLRAMSGSSPFGTDLATVQGSGTAGTWHQVTLSFTSGAATTVTLLMNTYTASAPVSVDDIAVR